MLRRIFTAALLLLLTLIELPAASLYADPSLGADESFIRQLEKIINEEGGEIIPASAGTLRLTSYSEDENAVYVTIEGYTLAFDRKDLQDSMESEVRSFFTYPVFIEASSSATLDYIYGSSYSSLSLEDARKGEVYDLVVPQTGKSISRFIVSSCDENTGLVQFDPVYIRKAYAGLPLVKKGSWAVSLAFSQVFSPEYAAAGSVRVKNTAWLYPFSLSLGFETGQAGDEIYFASLAGIEYNAYLGSLFDSSFTLIQDAHLYAGADLLLGYCGGFVWGASWRAGYAHNISRSISWSIGYENIILNSIQEKKDLLIQHRLSIGIGVMF